MGPHICVTVIVLGVRRVQGLTSYRLPDHCNSLLLAITVVIHCEARPCVSFYVNGAEKYILQYLSLTLQRKVS